MMKSCSSKFFLMALATVLLLAVNTTIAQDSRKQMLKNKPPTGTEHHEVYEGIYIGPDQSRQLTSPAYRYSSDYFFTIQVNTDNNGDNIVGDAANEPSIAIDPTNPDRMVIGWRQFNSISSSFRQAGYGYTLDGGESWNFPGSIEPGVFRSDPVLDADSEGNFYYNSLAVPDGSTFFCDVFRMESGSTEWDEGTFAQGGDKQWMHVDKSGSQGDGSIYAVWNQSFTFCPPGFFTRSLDGGDSYEDCSAFTGNPFWGTLTTDANGVLYVSGFSNVFFGFVCAISSNAYEDEDIIWDEISICDLDGFPANGLGPNPGGLLGQAWIAVDNSGGEYDGNIYYLCSVTRLSNGDPADVMFTRSTNGGLLWDNPIRVNSDLSTNNYQWFGTMSVAPNGRIDVVWLDTRDNPFTDNISALYYAYSTDGGVSFSDDVRLSDAFDSHLGWPQQNKMGDYFELVSDEDYAHLAWAATFNGEQDVYYSRISPMVVGIDESEAPDLLKVSLQPNPASAKSKLRIAGAGADQVFLKVVDLSGREMYSGTFQSEASFVEIDLELTDYSDGMYFIHLKSSGSYSKTLPLVVSKP